MKKIGHPLHSFQGGGRQKLPYCQWHLLYSVALLVSVSLSSSAASRGPHPHQINILTSFNHLVKKIGPIITHLFCLRIEAFCTCQQHILPFWPSRISIGYHVRAQLFFSAKWASRQKTNSIPLWSQTSSWTSSTISGYTSGQTSGTTSIGTSGTTSGCTSGTTSGFQLHFSYLFL